MFTFAVLRQRTAPVYLFWRCRCAVAPAAIFAATVIVFAITLVRCAIAQGEDDGWRPRISASSRFHPPVLLLRQGQIESESAKNNRAKEDSQSPDTNGVDESETSHQELDQEERQRRSPSLRQFDRLNADSPGPVSDAEPSYNDGGGFKFLFAEDERQQPFSLILNGRIQIRYAHFEDQSVFKNPTLNEFELERVRLGFRGYVYDRSLRYNIGTDFDSDGTGGNATSGNLLHAFAEIRLDQAFGIGWGDRMSIRGGFWRTNFGRQVAESSKRLQFVDRSLTSTFFNLGTNAGVALRGEFTYDYRPVRYEVALLNGFGTTTNSPRIDLDDNLAVAARIYHDLIGDYEIGESDNQLSPSPSLRIGASFAATRRTRLPPDGARDEFDDGPALLLVSDPASGRAVFAMDQLQGREREYDLWLWGLEASWKHCGWSLHTEYLFRLINNVQFADNDDFRDFTHGFYVQGGYFLTENMELTARHSQIFAHGTGSGSPIGADYDTTANATGGGLNFYFRGHNSKLQFDIFHYDGAPLTSSALNIRAGDEGVMFRTQYQVAF